MLSGKSAGATRRKGVPGIRAEVARFIEARDGHKVDPDDVFITDGASSIVRAFFRCAIRGRGDGVLVPLPQYPLYSASIAMCGGTLVSYALDEDRGWALDMATVRDALERAVTRRRRARWSSQSRQPDRAMPLGRAAGGDSGFCSAGGDPDRGRGVPGQRLQSDPTLHDFHKVYKDGRAREPCRCTRPARGRWVRSEGGTRTLTSTRSRRLSFRAFGGLTRPNVVGNCAVGLMVRPPGSGGRGTERAKPSSTLWRRARTIARAFNACEASSARPTVPCTFPRITLPRAAVEAARARPAAVLPGAAEGDGHSTVPGPAWPSSGTLHLRTRSRPRRSWKRWLSDSRRFTRGFQTIQREASSLSPKVLGAREEDWSLRGGAEGDTCALEGTTAEEGGGWRRKVARRGAAT